MNERDLGPTVNRREAYRKGWDASRRTTTADLEAAEARFAERYGVQHMAAFNRGWTDYAADHPKDPDYGTCWCGKPAVTLNDSDSVQFQDGRPACAEHDSGDPVETSIIWPLREG